MTLVQHVDGRDEVSDAIDQLALECFQKGLPPPRYTGPGQRSMSTVARDLQALCLQMPPNGNSYEAEAALVADDAVNDLVIECFKKGVPPPAAQAASPPRGKQEVVNELRGLLMRRAQEPAWKPPLGNTDAVINRLAATMQNALLAAEAIPADTRVAPLTLKPGLPEDRARKKPKKSTWPPATSVGPPSEMSFRWLPEEDVGIDETTLARTGGTVTPWYESPADKAEPPQPGDAVDEADYLPSTPLVKARGVPRPVRRVLLPAPITLTSVPGPLPPELLELLQVENAHRAEGMRWEAKLFFRLVRAVLYALERETFLDQERFMAQPRAEKWFAFQQAATTLREKKAALAGKSEAFFLAEEAERAKKRLERRVEHLPHLESDERGSVEETRRRESDALYQQLIGWWLPDILAAREAVLQGEKEARAALEQDQDQEYRRFVLEHEVLRLEMSEDISRLVLQAHRQAQVTVLVEEETARGALVQEQGQTLASGPVAFWEQGWAEIRELLQQRLAQTQALEAEKRAAIEAEQDHLRQQLVDRSNLGVEEWRARGALELEQDHIREQLQVFRAEDETRIGLAQQLASALEEVRAAEDEARAARRLEWGILVVTSQEGAARAQLELACNCGAVELLEEHARMLAEHKILHERVQAVDTELQTLEQDLRGVIPSSEELARQTLRGEYILLGKEIADRHALRLEEECDRMVDLTEPAGRLAEQSEQHYGWALITTVAQEERERFNEVLAEQLRRVSELDPTSAYLALLHAALAEFEVMRATLEKSTSALAEFLLRRPSAEAIQRAFRKHLA
eukprot:RCo012666